ncbi:MAG: tyrosine-type recombinase/integrase [Candidatus Doudnabacteria bacterium]
MNILNAITPECSNITWVGKYAYKYDESKNDINLKWAIKIYLENLQNSCAPNTLYCYSRDLNFLLEEIGNIKIASLNEDVLNNFITQLCCSGKKFSIRSGTTLNRIKSCYRSFFNYCYKRKYININLADEIHLIKSCSRFTTAITQEEISSLLASISLSLDTFSQRDKALFAVYAFAGIRKTEALALRISDYDRDLMLLRLPLVKRSSKKFQTIPSILSKILDGYLTSSGNADSSFPLFPGNQSKTYLSSRQVSNRFDKWKAISGIRENLTIHSFRTAYASQLYKKTKDPLLVSYALGHSSFNTTKKYIREDSFNFRSTVEEIFTMSKPPRF